MMELLFASPLIAWVVFFLWEYCIKPHKSIREGFKDWETESYNDMV